MRVDVDQARDDELPAGINRLVSVGSDRWLDCGNPAVRDPDVANGVETRRRIDDE